MQPSRLVTMSVDNLLIQYRSGSESTSSPKVAAIQCIGWNARCGYGNLFGCQGPRVTSKGSFCSVEL